MKIDAETWYRTRLGYFDSAALAAAALRDLRERFPGAWIDQSADASTESALDIVSDAAMLDAQESVENQQQPPSALSTAGIDEAQSLMADARRSMVAGELSRAIQIYTKILQLPPNDYHPDAQEFLALARERNGQIAHAKAEYERYLDAYPDAEGATRVRQRLAALVAAPQASSADAAPSVAARTESRSASPWRFRTFLSQYYRRDVNQINDQDEIVSQSAIYTDASLDARRRGERFTFLPSARLRPPPSTE